jgi:Uma2 family endonuclease
MGMPAVSRRWTRAEVLELIERNPLRTPRYELVDGVLLVTPGPSHTHASAAGELYHLLMLYCRARPAVGEPFLSPSDTELTPGTIVQPDVYVVPPGEADRLRRERTAHDLIFAAEVLSPRDPSGDRTRKRALYQQTVPEYWIVDPDARAVEIWRPGFARPIIERERAEWNPAGASEPFGLDVVSYFARVHRDRG